MFLQIAFDAVDCRSILNGISIAFEAGADAVELGTPVIANCGMRFISRVGARHPTQQIYTDTKTIDFPEMEIEVAFSLGPLPQLPC